MPDIFEQRENRYRLASSMLESLRAANICPATQRLVLATVFHFNARPEIFGSKVLRALWAGKNLLPYELVDDDLDKPGWRDTQLWSPPETPGQKYQVLQELRIVSYKTTESGLPYLLDLGGDLTISCLTKKQRDFKQWVLQWELFRLGL